MWHKVGSLGSALMVGLLASLQGAESFKLYLLEKLVSGDEMGEC